MYDSLTENKVLWRFFLRIPIRHKKRFNDVQLLSLCAVNVQRLGGYVLKIDLKKIINNDDEKCKQNSTVN